ncbi:VanZ family protein [Kribbella solani]|uniref:VanZ family protein n=1 Tax=Kribbella solani TaxID=236067 RepID=UPI0029A09348|nr:VanZ family protein [Kribbella solani]MDX2968938.1 VanZ family protein [Kribbella solani]MDX3001301.1 VanZ family protein [Kribbella solani]
MLETYRGIPHLLDSWLVLTGMTLPIAISSLRRPGDLIPRLAAFCLPATFVLVLAATLSPTGLHLGVVGQCGARMAGSGGLTSIQAPLNVLLFVPFTGMLTLAGSRRAEAAAAGIGLSASIEAIQALIPSLGRTCQLHDVMTNSLGAFCGVGLAAGLQTIAHGLLVGVRGRRLVTAPYAVEHAALLVVRSRRRPARHRRGTSVAPNRRNAAVRYHRTNTQLSG